MTDSVIGTPDLIDSLVGVQPGSRLDALRRERAEARSNAQQSYLALFEPEDVGEVTAEERFAVAAFVAGLHRQPEIAAHFRRRFAREAPGPLLDAVEAETRAGLTEGPYGSYPAGPLSREDRPRLIFRIGDDNRDALGIRLSAALEHAHLLVFRPRDASPDALQALLEAGWSPDGIVTLSQLVAFLAFQIRVVVGLKALSADIDAQPALA